MTSPTLLISDLHLSPADPATLRAFFTFLYQRAQHASALYILGDLFEYWLGDDQLDDPFYAKIANALAALRQHGVSVYFMPGNRDFLPGPRFAQAAGLSIIPDPSIIQIDGLRVLLAHGDAFCTDDIGYQRYRKLARNRLVQWIWLNLPRRIRNREAEKLRNKSKAMNQRKAMQIMDVNAGAIQTALRKYNTPVLIHGHTHKPDIHEYPEGIRYVLPDWHQGQGGYAAILQGKIQLYRQLEEGLSQPSNIQTDDC
ncbi:UDP-2,3-diacylglucosamine diphosphatase [Chitinibacter fontanus]|uniref:UDP-2,3-diacylglucosamine hydrolase n=1 Tax=Chitinibacter fontanus TaxID=1737446 RepID=A0A7D5VBC3_9NEIS|nr:UDP-2,3-diacylglucosamine diphosphatase [Chitinibacter fontanus]QLI82200.1 UDP-2,3-diacylglucosamine diphosphatase [Chitinibacter fontanus]